MDDSILPRQWGNHPTLETGERRLCIAMLKLWIEDAACCLTARRMMYSHDRTWPFSFEPLCELLGLEPDAVREAFIRRS